MIILKSVPLLMVITLPFLSGIAGAAGVDIQSGNSRVVADQEDQVYILNKKVERDVHPEFDYDDLDRVIPLFHPYGERSYRHGYDRDCYYQETCRGHSRSTYGSSSYCSTTVCH